MRRIVTFTTAHVATLILVLVAEFRIKCWAKQQTDLYRVGTSDVLLSVVAGDKSEEWYCIYNDSRDAQSRLTEYS